MKRRFKAATGESPMNYIQRIRIAIAREKLETTKLNIDQICQQSGKKKVDESIDPETVSLSLYVESPYFNENDSHQAEENHIEQVGALLQFQQNPQVGT